MAIDSSLPLLSPILLDSGYGEVKPNSSKGYRPMKYQSEHHEYSNRLSRREFLIRLAGGVVVLRTAVGLWWLASWTQTAERNSDPEFITPVSSPQHLESPP